MTFQTHLRSPRALVAPAVLAASLLAGPLMPRHASAAISYCRTDPMVYLSNGIKLDMQSEFAGSPGQLKHITYTAHVPMGVSVDHIVFTKGGLGHAESVQVYADNPTQAYDTDTVVTTNTRAAATATTTVLDQITSAKTSAQASGQTDQNLPVYLNAPTGGTTDGSS